MHALIHGSTELRFVMTTAGTNASRSIDFYEALGFEVTDDAQLFDGSRWIEMTANGQTEGTAVVTPHHWSEPRLSSGFLVASDDTTALESALLEAGVSVDVASSHDSTDASGHSFWFEDPLGNILFVSAPLDVR